MDLVKQILTTDGIWDKIGGFGYEKDECIPKKAWLHIIGKVDDKVIGMVMIHDTPSGYNKCHITIIPEYRKQHSKEFGEKGMQWIWDNTDFHLLVATIPTKHPNVRAYAELQGFVVFETITIKDVTMWLLSILRGEACQEQQIY